MAISSDQFTVVDLSRLPAPDVVEPLDFADLRDVMLADAAAFIPGFNALTPADPVYKLIEYFAYRELLLRARVNEGGAAVMLPFAAGADLDNLGALYGVERFILVEADAEAGIAEELESDDDFRDRIVRTPETFSVAGPVAAYVNLARNADSDVAFATCTEPAPGQVLVTVQSRTGTGAASAELIQSVLAYLSDEFRRPLGDQLIVQTAEILEFDITADIRTFAGPDPSLVLAVAQAQLETWLAENQRLGRDITEDGIHAQLRSEGVSKVTLTGWQDIVCTDLQAAHATNVTLTHVGVGE